MRAGSFVAMRAILIGAALVLGAALSNLMRSSGGSTRGE
jgi:hypothetical protein